MYALYNKETDSFMHVHISTDSWGNNHEVCLISKPDLYQLQDNEPTAIFVTSDRSVLEKLFTLKSGYDTSHSLTEPLFWEKDLIGYEIVQLKMG